MGQQGKIEKRVGKCDQCGKFSIFFRALGKSGDPWVCTSCGHLQEAFEIFGRAH